MDFATQVAKDWRAAPLAPADVAMLEFGEKLTLTPFLMSETDVVTLRGHAFDDRDIISIILAAAYRNYIVRVADALGVELNHTVEYPPEFVEAFGVKADDASTTLYADRQTAPASVNAAVKRVDGPVAKAHNRMCWLDDASAAPGNEVGTLAHLPRAFAQRGDALEVTAEFLRLVDFGGSGLGERMESLLGWTAAQVLYGRYMGTHHAARLLKEGMAEDDLRGGLEALDRDRLSPAEAAAVGFAEQLTRTPAAMARTDVASLRSAGLSDADVVTIAADVAVQNFVGRVVSAVGLKIEPALEPLADRLFPE